MKISYDSLRCPSCGSKELSIVTDDVFLCEYCNNKFNFNLDEIDLENQSKVFIQELKDEFDKKTAELYAEKSRYYHTLLYYKKLVSPKLLTILAIAIFFFSFVFSFISPVTMIVLIAVSIVTYFFSRLFKNKRIEKYGGLVTQYAKKVVECQTKIDLYTRLVSKLTK